MPRPFIMSNRYSERLKQLWGTWKRSLAIPGKKRKGTADRLRETIAFLWRRQGREFDATIARWDLDRLYAEYFERQAEAILAERWPSEYTPLRLDEDRERRQAGRL